MRARELTKGDRAMDKALTEMMEAMLMQAVKNVLSDLQQEVTEVADTKMEVKKLKLLKVSEVAEVLGTTVQFVYEEINKGRLEALELAGKKVRIAELERYINTREKVEIAA